MALSTLLFDLDGTLLPLNQDAFFAGYFGALMPTIAHLGHPQELQRAILKATERAILDEDPNLTNEDAFKVAFRELSNVPLDAIWPYFDDFYAGAFGTLRHYSQPTDISREICRTAIEKGYRLAVATNPVFPESAILHRLRWAGLEDIPFALITTIENMHFCKPNPKYYMEVATKLDAAPDECMMFGNDVQEDGVAGNVGMETFLVTDCLIDNGKGSFEFTEQGTWRDALDFVRRLPQAGKG